MVVETSALVAILLQEEAFEDLVLRMAQDELRFLSAASYLEALIVLIKKRGRGVEIELDRLILEMEIKIVPVTEMQVRIARQGHLNYGRGRHPAQLNLGDCFSYALAKQTGEPILFVGNDFIKTDLIPA